MATLGLNAAIKKKTDSPWSIGAFTSPDIREGMVTRTAEQPARAPTPTTTVNVGTPSSWQTNTGQGLGSTYSQPAPSVGVPAQASIGMNQQPASLATGTRPATPMQSPVAHEVPAGASGLAPQQAPATSGGLQPLPANINPNTSPGLTYIPNQGWTEVSSGADIVYYGPTNTFYYHGVPLTDAQVQNLKANGPGALAGGAAQASYMDPNNIYSNLSNLGFGTMPQQINAPQIGPLQMPQAGIVSTAGAQVARPMTVQAPRVNAEQGGFQDFDALEKSIYESQFNPVKRELERQSGLADRQLAAQLAQAGIAESGTGVGQRQQQADEFYRKTVAAAEDASSRAAQQRYGMEYEQSMKNAEMRQQANLANAGFDMEAQIANAQNLLQADITSAQLTQAANIAQAQLQTQASISGAQLQTSRDLANASNYLQAMNLNFQQQQAAKTNYLALLGLQQQDIQNMNENERQILGMFYNTYLQQLSIMVNAGQESSGKQDSSSSSINVQAEGGGAGAGGV